MEGTGIPPHVTLLALMQKVLKGQLDCVAQMKDTIKIELEANNVGGAGMMARIEGIFRGFDERISDMIGRLEIVTGVQGDREESRQDSRPRNMWN